MQLFLRKEFLEFTKIQISNILEDSSDNSFSMLPVKYFKRFIFCNYYYNNIYDIFMIDTLTQNLICRMRLR
jgi:hypothetical protein